VIFADPGGAFQRLLQLTTGVLDEFHRLWHLRSFNAFLGDIYRLFPDFMPLHRPRRWRLPVLGGDRDPIAAIYLFFQIFGAFNGLFSAIKAA